MSTLARGDTRDVEVGAGLESAEIQGRIVLAEQPDRDPIAFFSEIPEGVSALQHVGVGAVHIVGVEEFFQ